MNQFSQFTQSLSHVQLFETPWTAVRQVFLSINYSQSLVKLMSIESVIPSSHLILCQPLSSHLQSFAASVSFQVSQFFTSGGQSIGVSASASASLFILVVQDSPVAFSYESVLRIRRPKYWSFSFSISPSNEYSGLISFRMDWLDLLVVQGTLKSLLQHHSSKA